MCAWGDSLDRAWWLHAGGQSVWKALRSGYGQTERSQAQRLKAVLAERGIKVPLHSPLPWLPSAVFQKPRCPLPS